MKRLLTLTQACEYIGIKKATMYGYINRGKLKAFKLDGSRTWKFDLQDLDHWIENQKNHQTAMNQH